MHHAPTRTAAPATRSALSLLALLLALVALVLPAGAARADGAETLTLAPPSAPAKAGLVSTFTATLLEADGVTPEAGETVVLQRRDDPASATWTSVVAKPTDASGRVLLPATVALGAHQWRAVRAAHDARPELVSPVVSVPGVRLASALALGAPTTVVDERSVTLRITWTASDGTPISAPVAVQRRLPGGSWTAFATVRTGTDGTASLKVTPRTDTSWRLVGSTSGWWLGAVSRTATIKNLPPGKPVAYPKAAPRPAYTPPQGRAVGSGANVVVTTIPDDVWRSMVGRSWHAGCPVGRSGLRLLRVNYWGFDGYRYRGEMVLATSVVYRAGAALRDMYDGRFPIRRMYRVDRFGWSAKLRGANDYRSMGSDNTSGFNCRSVVNKPSVLSPHATGHAIDVNTWENPYRSATGLVPNSWWASRSDPRIAWRSSSHPVVRIWNAHGFRWTYGTGDSQHVDGRRSPVVLGGFTG